MIDAKCSRHCAKKVGNNQQFITLILLYWKYSGTVGNVQVIEQDIVAVYKVGSYGSYVEIVVLNLPTIYTNCNKFIKSIIRSLPSSEGQSGAMKVPVKDSSLTLIRLATSLNKRCRLKTKQNKIKIYP